MSIFTKHNNYEIPAVGAEAWNTSMDANLNLIERGTTIKGVAGTTILQNEVMYLDSNFKFGLAIAGGAAEVGKFIGFATTDLNINAQGYALHHGYAAGGSWDFTAGPVYLSDSVAGAVTQTEPTDSIVTGFAIQTTEILIKPWVENVVSELDVGEGYITLFPTTEIWVSEVGGWREISQSSQVYRQYAYNNNSNNLDYVKYKVYLSSSGFYDYKLHALSASNGAFCEVLIDDVPVGATFDMYSSSTQWNQIFTGAAGFTVETSGLKDLKISSNGKNPTSSGYRVFASTFLLYRVSDYTRWARIPLLVDVVSSVTVSDSAQLKIVDKYVEAADTITVVDVATLFIPILNAEAADPITVTDVATLELNILRAIVADPTTVTDVATLELNILRVEVADTVTVTELESLSVI